MLLVPRYPRAHSYSITLLCSLTKHSYKSVSPSYQRSVNSVPGATSANEKHQICTTL